MLPPANPPGGTPPNNQPRITINLRSASTKDLSLEANKNLSQEQKQEIVNELKRRAGEKTRKRRNKIMVIALVITAIAETLHLLGAF